MLKKVEYLDIVFFIKKEKLQIVAQGWCFFFILIN